MELNRDTKLKDIVSAYPSLKTRLAEINPKFSLLNSPIGKVMIGKVTNFGYEPEKRNGY